jgi:hypothetical protein
MSGLGALRNCDCFTRMPLTTAAQRRLRVIHSKSALRAIRTGHEREELSDCEHVEVVFRANVVDWIVEMTSPDASGARVQCTRHRSISYIDILLTGEASYRLEESQIEMHHGRQTCAVALSHEGNHNHSSHA